MIIFIIILFSYAYNSGSCKIDKTYICNDMFCLYKEFNLNLNQVILDDIYKMLDNKKIQKKVSITSYPENILNCALPNKIGTTITTQNILKNSHNLIDFYKNDLCKNISNLTGLKLFPTDLNLPTTCSILIYDNEGDWINWHYDYNYYNGRFFTVLIPITKDLTCTKFQFMDNKNEITSLDLNNKAIVFEGNYLYHRASKLCNNEKRVLLSCQYVTDNNISFLNSLRIKIKDFAYTGNIF
jgi:hypothetical protein